MFKEHDKEMKVDDIDRAYLKVMSQGKNHQFRNKALNNFFNELQNVIEDIENRKNIHNHVDAHGWFTVEVKVEKED